MTLADLKDLSPFAALLAVVYLLGGQFLKSWRETERERTASTTESMKAITGALTVLISKVDAHHSADIESHGEMATALGRIEKAQDIAEHRAQTSPNGVRIVRSHTQNGER